MAASPGRGTLLARAVELVFAASAWLLPLLVLPGLIQDAAGLPKDAVLGVAGALLAGAALARRLVFGLPFVPRTPLVAPLLALGAAALASQAGSRAPAGDVWPLTFLACGLAVGLLGPVLPAPRRYLLSVYGAAGLTALYGLGQYVGFDVVDWASHFRPRIFATLGNPVFLGGYLAAVFPFAFAAWLKTEQEEAKDLLSFLLAVLAIAVYLTWTRSAWLGLAASVAVQVAALATVRDGRRLLAANRTPLLSAAVVGVIAVLLIASVGAVGGQPVPVADRLHDAVNPRGYSLRFRLVTNEVCLRLARAHPVLGAGWGAYPAEYPGRRLGTAEARRAPDQYFASQETYAHDDHLQTLGEAGVAGFGVWLWLLVAGFRLGWRRARGGSEAGLGALGCLAAVACDALANFPLHIAPTLWIFFGALGLLGAEVAPPEPAPAPGRWRPAAALGLMLACGALAAVPAWDALRADFFKWQGDLQVASNNYEMAGVYYGSGLEREPGSKFLQFRYAVAESHAGQFEWRLLSADESLRHARRALALGYEDENVYKHLSDVFERKGAYAKAIAALDRAHALNPRSETVANNLSYFLALCETRYEDAIALARTAVAAAPEDPTYLDTLGYALLRAGRRAAAVPPLRQALARLPAANPRLAAARAEVLRHLALALQSNS